MSLSVLFHSKKNEMTHTHTKKRHYQLPLFSSNETDLDCVVMWIFSYELLYYISVVLPPVLARLHSRLTARLLNFKLKKEIMFTAVFSEETGEKDSSECMPGSAADSCGVKGEAVRTKGQDCWYQPKAVPNICKIQLVRML